METAHARRAEPARVGRRRLLEGAAAGAAVLAFPALGSSRRALPSMTEGPFYPPASWRARRLDWDNDLTRVRPDAQGQAEALAQGEWLDLHGRLVDTDDRLIDDAEIEIWQCDARGVYHHPRGGGQSDAGFQGFGSTRTDAQGGWRFRTIRPVPYPGRTPHIHVRLKHPAFGDLTSQLFVEGDPGNERDFLYRRLDAAQREAATLRLQRAPQGAPVMWIAERTLVAGL